jgi:hypothetical protein
MRRNWFPIFCLRVDGQVLGLRILGYASVFKLDSQEFDALFLGSVEEFFVTFEVASHIVVKDIHFDGVSVLFLEHDCMLQCVHATEA